MVLSFWTLSSALLSKLMISSSQVRSIAANGGNLAGTQSVCRKDIDQRVSEIIQIDSVHVELLYGRFILSKGYVRFLGIAGLWLSRIMVRRARVFFQKRCSTKRRSRYMRYKLIKALSLQVILILPKKLAVWSFHFAAEVSKI